MPRRIIRRYLPEDRHIRDHRLLRVFGERLHDPNLWHLNRYSVAAGFGVGLFCAFLPMPFEMVVAAIGAFWLRANLPISVALVWVSNPFTWIPLYGTGYLLGAWLLGSPMVPIEHITLAWLLERLGPLWLGCTLIGLVLGIGAYFTVQGLWRLYVRHKWRKRRLHRAARHPAPMTMSPAAPRPRWRARGPSARRASGRG